jgi:hypothetical protein
MTTKTVMIRFAFCPCCGRSPAIAYISTRLGGKVSCDSCNLTMRAYGYGRDITLANLSEKWNRMSHSTGGVWIQKLEKENTDETK